MCDTSSSVDGALPLQQLFPQLTHLYNSYFLSLLADLDLRLRSKWFGVHVDS